MPRTRKLPAAATAAEVASLSRQDNSAGMTSAGRGRARNDTRQALIDGAAAEFNERGFDGTDSNRIARRAGFAPQTFYRWFKGKAEIFIEVYLQWQGEEIAILKKLLLAAASDEALADACVAHHRTYFRFRRSLRQLAYENSLVREARAKSRMRQIEFIRSQGSLADDATIAAALLQLERLSDALAEGEFEDMGMAADVGQAALAAVIASLRNSQAPS